MKILLFTDNKKVLEKTEKISKGWFELIWCKYNDLQKEQYPFANIVITINEQISNFAQSYPANSITASIEAPLLINRYRFVSCSCFSCFCKKA